MSPPRIVLWHSHAHDLATTYPRLVPPPATGTPVSLRVGMVAHQGRCSGSRRGFKLSLLAILLFLFTQPPALSPAPEKVLLVSAYYPFPSAKHTQEEYNGWIGHFLSQVTSDIYFFTTPEMEDTIHRLRGHLPIIINTHYKAPFDIEPLKDRRTQLEHMHAIDRERKSHNPDLYAVWPAKPFFVNEALRHVEDLHFRRTQRPHTGFQASNITSRPAT